MAKLPSLANWRIISDAERLKYFKKTPSKSEREDLLNELTPSQRSFLERHYKMNTEKSNVESVCRYALYTLAALAFLAAFHIGMTKDAATLCSNDANMVECS